MAPTLAALRQLALARALFPPTSLPAALRRLRFVQADPIRAPARAQDLILFQRVADYRAGDLERRYPRLAIEEDVFVNYGFVTRDLQALLHPREGRRAWTKARWAKARAVRDFVRARGLAHPREVDAHFALGRVKNWFGGSSAASTQLLDEMHYRGLLRVGRREGGTRCYAAADLHERPPRGDPDAALDALVDAAVATYAPLPGRTLGLLVGAVARHGARAAGPARPKALARAKARLARVTVDGLDWYAPAGERWDAKVPEVEEGARLLAPFDPVVWDRLRFERFWGWTYRFEAYTPARKRRLGYYALPLLWRGDAIGWANLAVVDGRLDAGLGYVAGGAPRGAAFRAALDDELGRVARFLGVG